MKEVELFPDDPKSAESMKQLQQVTLQNYCMTSSLWKHLYCCQIYIFFLDPRKYHTSRPCFCLVAFCILFLRIGKTLARPSPRVQR
jgi:hypothetical protein